MPHLSKSYRNNSTKTLLTTLLGFIVLSASAAVYNSDGSVANVQALHNAAVAGDTITLPAGTFHWTTGVTISKSITLQGAGMNSTTITAGSITMVNLQASSSTVTGIHFILSSDGAGKMISMNGQNWRIHHNRFDNGGTYFTQVAIAPCASSSFGGNHPTGVIDNNQFFDCKIVVIGSPSGLARKVWHEPSKIGNPDQTGVVYIEDNYFYRHTGGTDAADAESGGRYVFRYNEVHNCQIEMHSSHGNARNGKSWEVYENHFFRDIAGAQAACIWERNGTGVIYNNTLTGGYNSAITLDNVRSFEASPPAPAQPSCNGTTTYDGNVDAFGWPCRDQIGRGPDDTLWNGTLPAPPQPSEPVYIWNNTHNGSPAIVHVANNGNTVKPGGSSHDIIAGRDYILGVRPNYTPYIYPHPLVSGQPTPTPTPTPDPTVTPTATPAPTPTPPNPTPTPTPRPTPTPTPRPTPTPTSTPTPRPSPTPTPTPTCGPPNTDFNHDGKPDYVLYNGGTRQTAVWYMHNNVFAGSAFGPTLPAGWGLASVSDFNRNGKNDYALFNASTRQTAIWYLSGVTFVSSAFGPTLPSGWTLVAVGKFNTGCKPDYVLYNASTRQTAIWYMDNNVYAGGAYGPTLPAGWRLVGVADFNRNGKTDYLLFNPGTRQTAVWYMNNNVYVSSAFGPTIASGYELTGTADFNRDGKPDYVLYNASTRGRVIWYLNNNVYVGGAFGPILPAGWNLVAP